MEIALAEPTRSPGGRRTTAVLSVMLISFLLAAGGAYSWDALRAKGDTTEARRVVWTGSQSEQMQAIVVMFRDASQSIEQLLKKTTCGDAQQEQQASIALAHLRQMLR